MKKKLIAIIITSIVAGTIFVGCTSQNTTKTTEAENITASEETTKDAVEERTLNLAIQPSAAFIPLYVAREKGWIEEALKEYNVTVNWTDFESGPPMNESFAAGQQDIGVIGDVPSISAIASGQDNTLIAVAADGGPAYALLAATDSDIETAADLKGKIIGTVVGSTAQNLTDKLLTSVGLDINNDVELINISAGDAQAVLSSGQVDAVAIWEPNVTRLVANGTAKIIGDGSYVGFRGVNVIFSRTEYVKKNADIVKVVLEQYYRGAQEFANNSAEVSKEIADYFFLDSELLVSASKKYDYTVAFEDADIAELQDTVSFLIGIEAITNEITVADHINKEIALEVVKEFKK